MLVKRFLPKMFLKIFKTYMSTNNKNLIFTIKTA